MMIRKVYWEALRGELIWADVVEGSEQDHDILHVGHCFDYIRQGIMCAGDMSIEGGAGEIRDVIDGMDQPHQCRSWVSYNPQALLSIC